MPYSSQAFSPDSAMRHLTFEDLAALLELVRTNNQYNDEPEHSFWESLEVRLLAECLPEFQP
jgi:hypothetical protein